jgi:D-amino-acid dehydrogenase
VVGAGVIGVCSAYYLAKSGARVTVVERDEVGKGASFGNAGAIAPGHTPINKPGRVKQAIKSLFDPVSPLYLAPRWDPGLVSWLWEFSRNCTPANVARAMQVLGPLGHESLALYDRLIREEQLDCDFRREGYYDIFLTEQGLSGAEREAALMRQHGYQPQILNGDEVRRREPAINQQMVGGVFYPKAATVDPYRFVLELAGRARHHGTTFRTGTEVVDVLERAGRVVGVRLSDGAVLDGDNVVIAAGAYSPALTRKLGLKLPLQPAKGYHRDRIPREGETPSLQRTVMLGEKSVFCSPMSGFVRFAGTLEFSGLNHVIRRPRLEQLTNAAKQYLNGVGAAESRSEWCGLRPCMSDGLPVVGPVPKHKGLVVATGHAMLGLTLGPVTGKLVAEHLMDGSASYDTAALGIDRF